MTAPRLLVVHLGRPRAMGERRRVASWLAVAESAGAVAEEFGLIERGGSRSLPSPRSVAGVAAGRLAPEVLAWRRAELRRAVARFDPDVVVAVTTRAYDPSCTGDRPVVLDLVDSLARSYADRAAIVSSPPRRAALRALGRMHARLERHLPATAARTAAGRADARALGASWFPILIEPPAHAERREPTHDLVFTGTLDYPPNVHAIERLSTMWASIVARRPGTRLLVAGARPTEAVRRLVARHGWTLEADFGSVVSVLARAAVSVAPLDHVAGMQIKVIDAAAHGLPQVVTPAVLGGLDPDFPATVAASDDAFVAAIVSLLEDPARRERKGAAARSHVQRVYTATAWTPWLNGLLTRVVPNGSRRCHAPDALACHS